MSQESHDFFSSLYDLLGLVAKSDFYATPTTVAWPGSSVHGISRQEYWNGLPFPSPMICYKHNEKTSRIE